VDPCYRRMNPTASAHEPQRHSASLVSCLRARVFPPVFPLDPVFLDTIHVGLLGPAAESVKCTVLPSWASPHPSLFFPVSWPIYRHRPLIMDFESHVCPIPTPVAFFFLFRHDCGLNLPLVRYLFSGFPSLQ